MHTSTQPFIALQRSAVSAAEGRRHSHRNHCKWFEKDCSARDLHGENAETCCRQQTGVKKSTSLCVLCAIPLAADQI
eukprot:3446016-Rhodomonas_salina.2